MNKIYSFGTCFSILPLAEEAGQEYRPVVVVPVHYAKSDGGYDEANHTPNDVDDVHYFADKSSSCNVSDSEGDEHNDDAYSICPVVPEVEAYCLQGKYLESPCVFDDDGALQDSFSTLESWSTFH